MALTFGQTLLFEHIPAKYRPETFTKKAFKAKMSQFAKEEPQKYAKSIQEIKRIGDSIATLDGISVGLDDIEPDYAARDAILRPAMARIKATTSVEKRRQIIGDTQSRLMDQAKTHQGTMGMMVRSGARGSAGQLMKAVVAPIGVSDEKDEIQPWLINKSYSEGLDHGSWFAAAKEARMNTIKSVTSVAEPGDLGKILTNNMSAMVVTEPDCGTHNGILMDTSDPEIRDRFLADTTAGIGRNTAIGGTQLRKLSKDGIKKLLVRSPMTCEAEEGVCQKCMGLDTRGSLNDIGVNVGLRAATSLSEPLVQMQLASKHATTTAGGKKSYLSGTQGFRALIESPENFQNKAALAPEDGVVTDISPAPQGGWFITVDSTQMHTPKTLKPIVKKGDRVEKGDQLTLGVPRPKDVVGLKGLGAGRNYLVNQLQNVYQSSGQNIDRRHLETLARTNLNHVQVDDIDDELADTHGLVRGDIVDYNRLQKITSEKVESVPLSAAVGRTLGRGVLHHLAGTKITPSVVRELKKAKLETVPVTQAKLKVTPIMAPATRNPLLNPDWAAKLGHRYLQQSILQGVHEAQEADIHSTNPTTGILFGMEFGEGSRGKY